MPEKSLTDPDRNRYTEVVYRFFAGTGPTYDRMANLCTFGFDRRWKKRMLERMPKEPVRILDQACGTGILTLAIARRYPRCLITGVDLQEEYLHIAIEKASRLGLRNVEFFTGRAEEFHLPYKYDCIASSYLAKYAELDQLISTDFKMLKEGGVILLHDFTYPSRRWFAAVWELYFRILQRLGSRKYPQWKTIFEELPGLIRQTRWVPETLSLLKEKGFKKIRRYPLTLETSTLITAEKA